MHLWETLLTETVKSLLFQMLALTLDLPMYGVLWKLFSGGSCSRCLHGWHTPNSALQKATFFSDGSKKRFSKSSLPFKEAELLLTLRKMKTRFSNFTWCCEVLLKAESNQGNSKFLYWRGTVETQVNSTTSSRFPTPEAVAPMILITWSKSIFCQSRLAWG